jgi:hypothetical protein
MKWAINAVGAGALSRALDRETDPTGAGFRDPETTARIAAFGKG